jgi:SAM-dependent methyltransferase
VSGFSRDGVSVDASLQLRVLESLQSATNYNDWVASLALPFLGEHPIEVGSGIGEHATTWLRHGVPRLTVSDTSEEMVAQLRRRFAGDERVAVTSMDVVDTPNASHSSVVAFNMLEHVADDVDALRGAARLVRPNGNVIVFVPAFEFAMSRFDRALGHYRRYRCRDLASRFGAAGLTVVETRYVNAPGLIAWFVGMRLLRMTPREGLTLRLWDRALVPMTRALESRVAPPFGQSVLGVATLSARS